MKTSNQIKNWIIILPFCLCILVPTLDNLFGFLPKTDLKENRKLAEYPSVELKTLNKFPSEYNSYFNDNFSMRGVFTKMHRRFLAETFRVSSVWNVIIGADNWLFQATKPYVDIYDRKTLFSAEELEKISLELQYRKAFIEKNGGKLYLAFAPTKNQIYGEKMPKYILKDSEMNKTEQLTEYLRENAGIETIELHQPILEMKQNSNEILYFKGDTHWTHFGAMVGAAAISKHLQKDFPAVPAVEMSDFDTSHYVEIGGNLASMIDFRQRVAMPVLDFKYKNKDRFRANVLESYPIPKDFAYKDEYEITKETIDENLPKLLCISDSYGGYIEPFLSPLFSRSVFIFDKWEFKLNEPIVENEQANIVLYLFMEGHINNLLENHSRPSE